MTTDTNHYDKNTIYALLVGILEELFEIAPDSVKPESNLYEDLDIDSIDAVDMAIRLQEITGKKIEPSEFKEIRTLADVVDAIDKLVNAGSPPAA